MRMFFARLFTPLVWRVPGHAARKLMGFARAEQGSRIDLLQAAAHTRSSARSALYLRHALDETRHASMFALRSAELRAAAGRPGYGVPVADTEALYETLGETGFLALVHRGERRGRQQFELYREHFARRGDARTAAVFSAILVDEQRHEGYTRELLVELSGGEPQARRLLARAGRRELWRTWRRAGRFLAERVYTLAMLLVYVVLGPLLWLLARLARPARPGWKPPR